MKEEISAVDLSFIIQELQQLVDSKIDKVFMPVRAELLFIFHKTGHGKFLLRVLPGKMLYLTSTKFKNPPEPHGFCMYLRKQLEQARVTFVAQKGFERIVEIGFEIKQDNKVLQRTLALELYSKGNVILLDEKEVIMSPWEVQEWKERSVKKGEPYTIPARGYNMFTLTPQDLVQLMRDTTQDAIVKALATDLGVGGAYAEEMCIRAQVRKTIRPLDATSADLQHLFEGIEAVRSASLDPRIVFKLGTPYAVTPFPFQLYEGLDSVPVATFNHGLDEVFTKHLLEKSTEKQRVQSNQDLLKTQKIVEAQELQVGNLRAAVEENQRKGELIYHNYALVKNILDVITAARKQKSWDEVKKIYKNNDVVTAIDEKNGTVVIELGFG